MTKHFYMQFVCADWLQDTALCAPATRGIWIDLLCHMHGSDRSGQITGTREQIARAGRCTVVELEAALADLAHTKSANVTFRDAKVTVINRRMQREAKERNRIKLAMQKKRGDGDVTPTRARNLDLESELELKSLSPTKGESDKGDKALKKLTDPEKHLAAAFEKMLTGQWTNDAGKWINRIRNDFGKSERVLAECRSAMVEAKVKTTAAQYAEQIWKEFA